MLERYSDLALILSHGGGALPHLIGRLTQGYRVRPECRLHASSPEELLGAFYFDTIVFDPKVLRHVVDIVGADRIILGTDYPFDMSDNNPVTFVRTAGLTEDEAQAILAGGAQLLGQLVHRCPRHRQPSAPALRRAQCALRFRFRLQ